MAHSLRYDPPNSSGATQARSERTRKDGDVGINDVLELLANWGGCR